MSLKSASQVSTFRLCKRMWGWRHLDRLRGKTSLSPALGREVHRVIERYIWLGEPLPDTLAGRIAAAGREHWPDRILDDPHVEIQAEMKYGKHTYAVRIDVAWQSPFLRPVVMDHKVLSQFERFRKSAGDLRDDPQVALYAMWACRRWESEDALVIWLYYDAEPPHRAHPVEFLVTRDEARDALREVDATSTLIDMAREAKRALDLAPDQTACEAYGGCEYRQRCLEAAQW